MFSWRFPLKIEVPKYAYCKYDPTEQQYIIMIYDIVFRARQSLSRQNEYIQLKNSKERFLSVDSNEPKPMEKGTVKESIKVDSMKFDTNIIEADFKNSSLSKKGVKGRIVVGRCKSAYFDILQAITTADL